MRIKYEVDSVCMEPWAERIANYWKYLTGKRCYVLLGKSNDSILLIKRKDPDTGEPVQGLLFESPVKYPYFRNFVWHEAGHLFAGRFEDPIENEFQADKWAIDKALSRGFNVIAEEIIFRCVIHCDNSINPVYRASSEKIISHYIDFGKSIVKKYNS